MDIIGFIKQLQITNKRIAKRYDGLGGSHYLITVAAILYDEQITEEDIKDFSEETKEVIHRWISVWSGEK